MTEHPPPGGNQYSVSVGGSFEGQLATGDHIMQVMGPGAAKLSPAEQADLAALFDDLRQHVATEAPADLQPRASERVAELQEALTAETPDLTTVQLVKRWFTRHLPTVAGSVSAVLINPLVGVLVKAGGDALVGEFAHIVEDD